MGVLYALESIRTPALDKIMSVITLLGGELFFMVIAVTAFWCVSKREGYYLMIVGFFGTVINQFLKILCCVPRPWIKDPDFTIVESARAEATGYSFPSGHTQNAVATYGGIARYTRRGWLRVVLVVLTVLIAFSRMYLGVHTPLDVGVSFLIAAVLVVGALLTAVVLSLRGGSARQEPEADPHAGQVYINDGFNMVWMTPHEGIPASGLAQEDFRRDTNDDGSDGVRVRYLGAEYATRWGVDVSNHQGTIDWAALKRQGIDFAYLRLGLRGYGEKGSLYPDRSFDSYYSGARAAGIDVGVYFFSQAATVQEAAQEALYALQLLDGRDLDLPVYYDWEPVQQEDSRTLHNNEFLLTSQARTFCALIEQGGYEAGVYMNRQQGYYRYDLPSMGNIALWIADPGDYPDFYYRFDVWQYDHGARLDGVNEIVDLNVEFVPVM